jgi:NAD(P)-dependent dehydrogenase (short-subunit alcohol dehydrogenase family)
MAELQANGASQAVLVTGCSSGIGRATAEHLAQHGYLVLATVRKEADAENLRALNEPNLVPICPLDLSRPEQISAAVVRIADELRSRGLDGLYAIVNNAGGGSVAPIELMDLDKFRVELEARVVGPIALLQAFLPMIRQAHGRILWIATPALLPIPFVSSIHACDFAINCIARTLQIELKPWKIPVVMVRCGGVKTAAPAKSARELEEDFAQWPPDRFALYRNALQKEQAELAEFDMKRSDPIEIARVIYTALQVQKPRRRYQIGYMAGVAATVENLPQCVVDTIMERRA